MSVESQLKKFHKDEKRRPEAGRLGNLFKISFFFLPLSIIFSCILIVLMVITVPGIFKGVMGAFQGIFPAPQEQLHSSANGFFKDVDQTSPYFEAVNFLKKYGVIEGYEDGTFRPDNKISRAEFVKTVVESRKQYPLGLNYSNCFDDVKTEWFSAYVCFAKDKNWIEGVNGKFNPQEQVSRAEIVKIVVKAFDLKKIEGKNLQKFADVEVDAWVSEYVEIAVANDILTLDPAVDLFEPGFKVLRGEVAEVLYRSIKLFQ